jgi:SlyX protein
MNDDARLVSLEERLTFQQRLIDELNSVVLQQRRELDRLTQEFVRLQAAMQTLRDAAALGENLPHEKPPHY